MNHCLLVVAHGSRREESNDEVRRLTEQLRREADGRFNQVACGFLELAEPSIPEAVDDAIARGADGITILPYFLSAGRHVVSDIPEIIAVKQAEYPDKRLSIAPHLGAAQDMTGLMLSLV